MKLSCINLRGHMHVIHGNASSYSHTDKPYICKHVLIYVHRDGHRYVNIHIYIYAGYSEVPVLVYVRNAFFVVHAKHRRRQEALWSAKVVSLVAV